LIWLLLGVIGTMTTAAEYYVSPAGDDSNPGTKQKPWQTIAKVNSLAFEPGSKILFQSGQSFSGGLAFDKDDRGTASGPITVSSYGPGRAVIRSGSNEAGLHVVNTGFFIVENINFQGPGPDESKTAGIHFHNELEEGVQLEFIRINDVEVSGFGTSGITIGSKVLKSGFRNVRIERADVHDNRLTGIDTYGPWPHDPEILAISGCYVGHCRVYRNRGAKGLKGHSGSGIKLCSVTDGTIERCVAFENGGLGDNEGGGPIGIWAHDSRNIVIQFCEAYRNYTGNKADGGGFDIDGGVVNSVMQYNYSHDNDGAGYLVCQYAHATRPLVDCTVRYNVSENDGRKNGYASIVIDSGPHPTEKTRVGDFKFYGNTILMTKGPHGHRGYPPVISIYGTKLSGVRFWNNIFIARDGMEIFNNTEEIAGDSVMFQGNCYFTAGDPFKVTWNGKTYGSLDEWRRGTGQETLNGKPCGLEIDPGLTDIGKGVTLDDADKLKTLSGYKLVDGSPLVDRGLDIRDLFGEDPGKHDYFETPIPKGKGFDIGAHEK